MRSAYFLERMFDNSLIRRLVVGASALAAAVALALGLAPASPGSSPPRHVRVRAGDTLWQIAERAYPHSDPRAAVDRIERANALEGALIATGRRLVLP